MPHPKVNTHVAHGGLLWVPPSKCLKDCLFIDLFFLIHFHDPQHHSHTHTHTHPHNSHTEGKKIVHVSGTCVSCDKKWIYRLDRNFGQDVRVRDFHGYGVRAFFPPVSVKLENVLGFFVLTCWALVAVHVGGGSGSCGELGLAVGWEAQNHEEFPAFVFFFCRGGGEQR